METTQSTENIIILNNIKFIENQRNIDSMNNFANFKLYFKTFLCIHLFIPNKTLPLQ